MPSSSRKNLVIKKTTKNRQMIKKGLDLSRCIGLKPGDLDCVLGRGGESNHHVGTKHFRALVDSRKQDFAKAITNREKADVVWGCIASHKANGGRIVGKWEGSYYEATADKQYNKVIQRLRERKKHPNAITKEQCQPPPSTICVPVVDMSAILSNETLAGWLDSFEKPFFPVVEDEFSFLDGREAVDTGGSSGTDLDLTLADLSLAEPAAPSVLDAFQAEFEYPME
ncbi:expressed unknown protein [Seminavis robusta]|uniref:DUF6824 domain-containing protein n=1 Tax=Seminavis robusta TaxID=568900 RepID=A0A9N8EIU3_9STRA|nr:expressed unknown protein [Seminavis robusta]|eukprot:Sro1270_g257960.1 n/a (226) ;mRNA; f:16199-16876